MMWGDGDRWGMHHGGGWGLALLMTLLMLAVIGLLVALLVTALRASSPAHRHRPAAAGGIDVRRTLDRRFAAGEIDEQEWRSRRDALRDVDPDEV